MANARGVKDARAAARAKSDVVQCRTKGCDCRQQVRALKRRVQRLQKKVVLLEVEKNKLQTQNQEAEAVIRAVKQEKNEKVAAAKDKARRDSLTGLYLVTRFNRLVLDYIVDTIRDRRGLDDRRSEYAALWVIDLDDFKLINKLVGHHEANLVLQVASKVIAGFNRKEVAAGRMKPRSQKVIGLPGRLGGDEFGVFQTGLKSPLDAYLAADRVMAEFWTHEWENPKLRGFKPKMSIGVAILRTVSLHPDLLEEPSFENLRSYAQVYSQSIFNQWIHAADSKMYEFKSYHQIGVTLLEYDQSSHTLVEMPLEGHLAPKQISAYG